MAENGSVSGQYEGDNYASPSPSTGSGNSIRQMGGNSKELFDLFLTVCTTEISFFTLRLVVIGLIS